MQETRCIASDEFSSEYKRLTQNFWWTQYVNRNMHVGKTSTKRLNVDTKAGTSEMQLPAN